MNKSYLLLFTFLLVLFGVSSKSTESHSSKTSSVKTKTSSKTSADDDLYDMLTQKLKTEKKSSSETDLIPEPEKNDKHEDEMDRETDAEEKSNLIGLSSTIYDVNTVSVTLTVSVDLIERVWCQAVPEGSIVYKEQLQSQFPGEAVPEMKKTMNVVLTHLKPDTSYSIHCYGLVTPSASGTEVTQPEHIIHTRAATIAITGIKYYTSSISFIVESNIHLIASCSLFNSESSEIASLQTSIQTQSTIKFEHLDLKQKYFTKCAIYDGPTALIASEIITLQKPLYSLSLGTLIIWGVITLLILIILFLLLSLIKFQKKNQTIYDLDDIEKIGLLKRRTLSTVHRRDYESDSDSQLLGREDEIQCSQCGFKNPRSTTVCRACNCVLNNVVLAETIMQT